MKEASSQPVRARMLAVAQLIPAVANVILYFSGHPDETGWSWSGFLLAVIVGIYFRHNDALSAAEVLRIAGITIIATTVLSLVSMVQAFIL